MSAHKKDAKAFATYLLDEFDEGFNGVEVDVEPDDMESWSRTYGNVTLNIIPPDDDDGARRYFDEGEFLYDLRKHIASLVPWARVLRGDRSTHVKKKPKPGEWVIWFRERIWGLSVEIYRQEMPRKRASSKTHAEGAR